jgi:hypothetical protein
MGILMDHFKKLSLLVKMVTSVKKTNKKNHVSFMPYAFPQSEHPFGQCEHFSQVEPFEKP